MSDSEAAFIRVLNTNPHARAAFDAARYSGDDEVTTLKRVVVALSRAHQEAMGIATQLARSQAPSFVVTPSEGHTVRWFVRRRVP